MNTRQIRVALRDCVPLHPPEGPKMSQSTVAKYMRKSKAFIQKWIRRYNVAKNIDYLPGRGSIGHIGQKKNQKKNSESVFAESCVKDKQN